VSKIVRVAGDYGLPGSPSAQDHVGVHDICGARCCQQASYASCIHAIKSHDVRCRLANETR
jgi:uncharacterized protein YcgI (DUF1989 family)